MLRCFFAVLFLITFLCGCVAAADATTYPYRRSERCEAGQARYFSFLKVDKTTRVEIDQKLKALDTGFESSRIFWGRFLESSWAVGAIVVNPNMPVLDGGRI